MMIPDKKDILRRIYLFSGLAENDLETLAQVAIPRVFGKAGKPMGFIYFLRAR